VLNNTVVNNGSKGSFLYVGGHVDGITVMNNLFVTYGGKPGASAIYNESADFADFKAVSHNVWPTFGGKPALFAAHRGVGAEQLKGMPQVSDNVRADVAVDADGVPRVDADATDEGEPLAAVRFDRRGTPRPAGKISAGAVEIPDNKNH
jgi:hypothetical protein